MTQTQKIILVVGILVVDMVLFFLPLTAIFLAYVILVNPPWVKVFVNQKLS